MIKYLLVGIFVSSTDKNFDFVVMSLYTLDLECVVCFQMTMALECYNDFTLTGALSPN